MHTVGILQQAIRIAERLGYGIRFEWLNGSSGGACEVAGKKWLFVDLALNTDEQLLQVTDSIRTDPAIRTLQIPAELRGLLMIRRSA